MYFYRLIETEYNNEYEDGHVSEFTSIYHEKEFTNDEFHDMCKEVLAKLQEEKKNTYGYAVSEELRVMFNFQRIVPIASFEYEIQ